MFKIFTIYEILFGSYKFKKRVGTPDRIEIRDDISGLIESYDVDILIVNRFLLLYFFCQE